MSDLKKVFIGQRLRQFPGKTFNTLIAGEERDRNKSAPHKLTAMPQKSPVIVRLAWEGDELLPPGNVVKLGDVLFTPTAEAGAPFGGLQFKCSAFEGDDSTAFYAIAMGPIEAATYDGETILTRGVGYGVMPQAWWAKINVTDADHTHGSPSTGTLLTSGTNGLQIIWKESGTGEKWAVVAMSGGGTETHWGIVGSGGISALSGISGSTLTPGSGTVQEYNSDGTIKSGVTETWYNWMNTAIPQHTPVLGNRESDGQIWVKVAGCDTLATS